MQFIAAKCIPFLLFKSFVAGFSQPHSTPDTQGRAEFEKDRLVRHVMLAPGGGSPESDPLIMHLEAHERKGMLKRKQFRIAAHNLTKRISEAKAWIEAQQTNDTQRRMKHLSHKNGSAHGFSVFLAPPTNSTTKADAAESEESIDAQIAALSSQLGGLKDKVSDAAKAANVTNVPILEFQHHCTKEARAKLDNMKDEDIEPKKDLSDKKPKGKEADILKALEGQMEASQQQNRMENQEFLLGLLMHKDWSYEQQMDAICHLNNADPLLLKLYKHHNKKESLATQLAKEMDAESAKTGPTQAWGWLSGSGPEANGNIVGNILAAVMKHK